MFVNIISDTNRRIPRKRILELMALMEEEEDPPDSNVNIVFVNDKQIASLNKKFRTEKFGITFRNEMLRLCCHGFLHLLGYDHEKPKERVIMQEREHYFLGNML